MTKYHIDGDIDFVETRKAHNIPLKTAKISYLYMLYLQYEKMDFDMGMFGASFCHCTSTHRIL